MATFRARRPATRQAVHGIDRMIRNIETGVSSVACPRSPRPGDGDGGGDRLAAGNVRLLPDAAPDDSVLDVAVLAASGWLRLAANVLMRRRTGRCST
jgi:hypothetical protein